MTDRIAFDLRVTLSNTDPPIWRELQVPSTITLKRLHEALQVTMGWSNYHLHCFCVNELRYGPKDLDFDDGMIDESRKRLNAVLAEPRERLSYEYDFGDGWEHEIVLDRIFPVDASRPLPVCVDGGRACPPEDVGGPYGYHEFLEALAERAHPRHAEFVAWIGEEYEPGRFDIHSTNVRLGRVFRSDA